MISRILQELDLPPMLQLFNITLNNVTYFVTNSARVSPIYWNGQLYTPFPLTLSNIGYTEDNASDKPRMTFSNTGRHYDLVFPRLPNLKGASVELILTFEDYIGDTLATATTIALSKHKYKVAKLTSRTETQIVYELDSLLEFAGLKMPRRQALRDGKPRLRFSGLGYNKAGM